MALVPVGIALGSNLGDRDAELDAGIDFLCTLSEHGRVVEAMRIESLPMDCPPGSPPFLNGFAEIEVDTVYLPPLLLLACLQDMELTRGRSPLRARNSPRPLDLDIIYYGVEKIDELGLTIPHPQAHRRSFVLEPLAHIHPDMVLPGQTKSVSELLEQLKRPKVGRC